MNLTREHLQTAVAAGLSLTDADKDLLDTYRRHTHGITILRAILEGIEAGNIALSSAKPPETAELPPGVNPEDLKPGGTNGDD